MEPLSRKISAFNWNVEECDGHDVVAIVRCIEKAKSSPTGPTAIICHTVKGKGVSFMENTNEWHGKALNDDMFEKALDELNGREK